LLLFLLVGAIPGTTYTIPAAGMLFIVMVPLWIMFVRFMMLESVQTELKIRSAEIALTIKSSSLTNVSNKPKAHQGRKRQQAKHSQPKAVIPAK
jgi:hypothetical protein